MKTICKTLAICFVSLLAITNCKEEVPFDGYIIQGKVKGLDSGWVKLLPSDFVDRGNITVVDSVQMQNGSFEFKGKLDHVDMYQISIDNKYRTLRGFVLENSPITLEFDVSHADKYNQLEAIVTGSKYQDLLAEQEAKDKSIFQQKKYAPLEALNKEMREAYKSKDENLINKVKEKTKTFQKLRNERLEEYQMSKVNYVKNNPSSPISPYVLSFQFSEGRMNKDRMKEVFDLFEGDAKNTAMYNFFQKKYKEIFETFSKGAKVPDFTLTAVDGAELTLSKVKGKYILIDFWASWCVPCRASFPHLKELYKKYNKNGFEVIGIGTADEEPKWRQAVKEDKTPWLHVYDKNDAGERKNAYGKVAKMYSVPFLPTTFLVDEDGVIVARQPRGKNLDNKLKEVFGY